MEDRIVMNKKPPWKMMLGEYQNARPVVVPGTAMASYVDVEMVVRKMEWTRLVCQALMEGRKVPHRIVTEYLEETVGALPPSRREDYPDLAAQYPMCFRTEGIG